MNRAKRVLTSYPSSISFSGAGFLGCYHLGVASCLVKYGLLLGPKEIPSSSQVENHRSPLPILIGASAGSMVAAGVSAGVRDEDGMNIILECVRRVREKGGFMDSLRPGFSLVDQVEDLLIREMRKACEDDNEYFLKRIDGGRLLRITLTDSNKFLSVKQQLNNNYAFRYMDEYSDFEDVVAASMLSSFVPGTTGPILGAQDPKNLTIKRSSQRIRKFLKVKKEAVKNEKNLPAINGVFSSRDLYWDGGLCTMFPKMDNNTWIVAPLNGDYSPNLYISPDTQVHNTDYAFHDIFSLPSQVKYMGYKIGLNQKNLQAGRQMILSSDPTIVQQRFYDGYDDTKKFLKDKNYIP